MSAALSIVPDAPRLRICDPDGTVHFGHLKRISKSGQQYLQAVNVPTVATTPMLIGTAAHFLVLGPRTGAKPLLKFDGPRRQGKAWDAFEATNDGADILTAPEWEKAERIAESVLSDPVALARLTGARFETPLAWEEAGVKFSTSGTDIITREDALGDLKSTNTVEPEAWERQAFRMGYPQQVAFYRRGARANGITCKGGLFLLGVETSPPYEVVDLDLTERLIDLAERSISLWIERFRAYRSACPQPRRIKDWPGYAQSRIAMDIPSWAEVDDEEE